MKKLRIVQISESDFGIQGHGVHTAFLETLHGLQARDDVEVSKNNFHAADIRHIHTVGVYALVQLMFGRGKKVISAHVVPASFVGSLVGAKYWLGLAKWYLRWFYNRAALVIAVSDQTKQELEALGVKRPIRVIYNMVDTKRYKAQPGERQALRKKLGLSGEFVVVSNGQVQPRKRFDSFIKMASELPEMRFIWVGGMPFGRAADDFKAMQDLIKHAPENVTVTGVVSLEKVREYFIVADVFVMPSMQETFGLAIVEAAASGLPLVLRDIPDYDQTFRADAVMTREGQFDDAVRKLASDTEYYQQMQAAAARVAKRFDSQTITAELIDTYRSLLG